MKQKMKQLVMWIQEKIKELVFFSNEKILITKNEVFIRLLIIGAVFIFAFMISDHVKQWVNVVGFLIAFGGTVYLHKHFFPFITASIICYLMASSQELFNAQYVYLTITKVLWSAGNMLLVVGIISFIYRLNFKYQIVEHDIE